MQKNEVGRLKTVATLAYHCHVRSRWRETAYRFAINDISLAQTVLMESLVDFFRLYGI
jgi:hypothetical protein